MLPSMSSWGHFLFHSTTGGQNMRKRPRLLPTASLAALLAAAAPVRAAVEYTVITLDALGPGRNGQPFSHAYGVNSAGATAGISSKLNSGPSRDDIRPVRWNAGTTAVTELGNIGTDTRGFLVGVANDINDAGTVVGNNVFYASGTSQGIGTQPLRWESGSTTPTLLDTFGSGIGGQRNGAAEAVNSAGTTVGRSVRYVNNSFLGDRAARWDAGSTAATELPGLGGNSIAWDLNDAGTIVGQANKVAGGTQVGTRAVRWDPGAAAATELGGLGGSSYAYGINQGGIVVGYAEVTSFFNGRPVRWEPGSLDAVEMGNLGTAADGSTMSRPSDINTAGLAVGYANKYVNGVSVGPRATLWRADGSASDLNELIDPVPGLTLTHAYGISDTGYIVGIAADADDVNWAVRLARLISGDANYDGRVDGTDFALLAGNFGKAGQTWRQGDFTGEGSVDGSDFALLAGNFGRSGPGPALAGLSAQDEAAFAAFAAGHGLAVPVVPEPSAAALAAVGGLLLCCRRARRPKYRPGE
jgi:hypothetical protein